MPTLKLTKNELKKQKDNLKRFQRYLPTLDLKKRLLQRELDRVQRERKALVEPLQAQVSEVEDWIGLLGEEAGLNQWLAFQSVDIRWENVAGVEVPVLERTHIHQEPYDLFAQPLWLDRAAEVLRELMTLTARIAVLEEQVRRLERELRTTAQRVNLFEQIKIPEARENIRRISIYLADAQTAAFGWALVAKRKLEGVA
jgi:V/A-type H+/Na+-transporting ATPase subunit D